MRNCNGTRSNRIIWCLIRNMYLSSIIATNTASWITALAFFNIHSGGITNSLLNKLFPPISAIQERLELTCVEALVGKTKTKNDTLICNKGLSALGNVQQHPSFPHLFCLLGTWAQLTPSNKCSGRSRRDSGGPDPHSFTRHKKMLCPFFFEKTRIQSSMMCLLLTRSISKKIADMFSMVSI